MANRLKELNPEAFRNIVVYTSIILVYAYISLSFLSLTYTCMYTYVHHRSACLKRMVEGSGLLVMRPLRSCRVCMRTPRMP